MFRCRAGTLDNLGKRTALGKFNLGNPKLSLELELTAKFNLGSSLIQSHVQILNERTLCLRRVGTFDIVAFWKPFFEP